MRNYITNYDPFFDNFFSDEKKYSSNMMRTDIRELDKSYVMEIELPKVKKEDTKISLKDGYLTISATYNNEEQKEGKYLHRERRYGECSRSYYVGSDVKIKDVSAKLKDGVLTVSIKKVDEKEKEKEHLVAIE
ncbi:MAG TPA: Hsp20/alpha crystallin family protein [Erysipelotrichaceae bacterium]|nr:Hsp20/alpha crystallin family protein [Erysipelotrichaceae bacterium]